MKIQPRAFNRFAERIEAAVRAVLVYGPDGGLVRERAQALLRAVVPDGHDPFRIAELTMAAIADAPGRLFEEVAAIAFTGGRRVVRIVGATDRLSGSIAEMLTDATGDALVLIEAGELGPRSSLRQLCEESAAAAAVACYADDEDALEALIEQVVRGAKLAIEPAAVEYLK